MLSSPELTPAEVTRFTQETEVPGHECGLTLEISIDAELTFFEAAADTVPIQSRGDQAFGGYVRNPDSGLFEGHKAPGSIGDVIRGMSDEDTQRVAGGIGDIAITHVRWSTLRRNMGLAEKQAAAQPYENGRFAGAVNGNTDNAIFLAIEREIPVADCPTDSIAQLRVIEHDAKESGDMVSALKKHRREAKGGYAIGVSQDGDAFAMRDPHGLKPLSIGQRPNGNYIFASESVVFDEKNARFVRDVAPGEIVEIRRSEEGLQLVSHPMKERVNESFCSLEVGYFMRRNSLFRGLPVSHWRSLIGKQLAKEIDIPNPDDFVIAGIPESGLDAASAFAEAAGITYIEPFKKIKNKRSFIAETKEEQQQIAKEKLDINARMLYEHMWDDETGDFSRTLILVDDSVVKGNQIRQLVRRLHALGVPDERIQVMVPFPEIKYSCHLGSAIDEKKLLSYKRIHQTKLAYLGVSALRFLSLTGFQEAVPNTCGGCFNGAYPVEPLGQTDRNRVLSLTAA